MHADDNDRYTEKSHRDFVSISPKVKIKMVKDLGPYRKGDTPTVTAAVAGVYKSRGVAEDI